ncbi:MAG TPA: A24 family peptidase [Polyangiaceae bacterium]|nr:A24 family peptidase [Polyangiaceae bacterium]
MSAMDPLFVIPSLVTAIAAIIDWRTGHIPNRLVFWGLVAGLAARFAVAAPQSERSLGLLNSAAEIGLGLLVCAAVPLVLFRMGAMGGGDVKLLAVLGACAGPSVGMRIQVCAFMVGALLAAVMLARTGQLSRLLRNVGILLLNPFLPRARRREIEPAMLTSLRFGPAICAATLWVGAETWFS